MGLIEIDVFESLKEILASIEEQPMAISKKSNHKKKRVPQRKKTSEGSVFSTFQWELASFLLQRVV